MEEGGQHMHEGEGLSLCLSFNSYSSIRCAEIAAKVTEETSNDVDGDGDFEFALVRSDADVTADEVLRDGQVRRVFPVFNRDLLICDDNKPEVSTLSGGADQKTLSTLRLPLKELFVADREEHDPLSSSSSEADEFECLPAGTYCVWRPESVQASPSRCKKSNSTGSASKRWKIRDLLRRSNSEGKDSFVFLTPKNRAPKAEKLGRIESPKEAGKVKVKGVAGGGEKPSLSSAHETFYVQNRASKEGDKRKSYLPYRQDLVGLFANVNGFGRIIPPF